MRACLARICGVLLGSALLAICDLVGSAAHAQQRDDAWVIAQVMAGKFEELRALEKLSDEGVPFAMYWWGSLMQFCVFDRCDQQAALELLVRAAKAGHGRAQGFVFALAAKLPGAIPPSWRRGVAVPKDGIRATDACHPVGGRPIQQGRPKGACRLRCPGHVGAARRAACGTRETGRPVEARR